MNYLQGFIIRNAKVKITSLTKEYGGANIKIPSDSKQIFRTINDVLEYIDSNEDLYDTGWGIPIHLYDYTFEEKNGYVVLHKHATDGEITVSFQMLLPTHIMTTKELDILYPLM